MIHSVNTADLWRYFKVQKHYFSLVNTQTNFPLFERDEEHVQHKLFFKQEDAIRYKEHLVKSGMIKAEYYNIHPTNIDELFEEKIIKSLLAYADTIFKLPLKISIALMIGNDIIIENDVLDETLYYMN